MRWVLCIDPGFSEVRVAALSETGEGELCSLSPETDVFDWALRKYGTHPESVVIAGGRYAPCPAGPYLIDERMAEDARRFSPWHPRNRMTVRVFEYCTSRGIPGVAVDPMSSAFLPEKAQLSGHPAWERRGVYYAFPALKAFSAACKSMGLDTQSARGVVAYLGDEVSVSAHDGLSVVETSDPVDCEGPYGFTSAGTAPATAFVSWLHERHAGDSLDETVELLKFRSGAFAYAGVPSISGFLEKLAKGDGPAVRAVRGMAYQVAKEIGRALAALKGKADAIVLTGPGVSAEPLAAEVEDRVAKWCTVVRVPHDGCMRMLGIEGFSAVVSNRFVRYPGEKRS
ncbi:MAG TPA: hypothetical protein GX500_06580 [Firmicutes bacterium]|nr:hypothetical protein [Candidatus Fermentithermobacillaceae bacterium]